MLCLGLTMNAQTAMSGVWNIGKENTKIKIVEDNGVLSATVVSSDSPKLKAGTLFLKEVKSVGGEWKGKLYNAKKKKWYAAVLKEKGSKLEVEVDAGMMSKTLEWAKE